MTKNKEPTNFDANNTSFAPLYVIDRYSVGSSESMMSIDLRIVGCPEQWFDCFPTNVDWREGWRQYWHAASKLFATDSFYSPNKSTYIYDIFFENGAQSGGGGVIDVDKTEQQLISLINEKIIYAKMEDKIKSGVVGIFTEVDSLLSRPTITLLTSGPNGGVNSALFILYEIGKLTSYFAVGLQKIRSREQEVVRFVFMPEIYSRYKCKAYGIDWALWSMTVDQNRCLEWGSACLIWCDNLLNAIKKVRERYDLMIDRVAIDYCTAAELHEGKLTTQYLIEALNTDPREVKYVR